MSKSHFDESAATWDNEPRRIEMMKVVGEAILREAHPTKDMDMLDYGCGTGLVGLYLLPYVRSVTGADSSAGMLDVLRKKIAAGGIENMHAIQLDLEHDAPPAKRYHMIVSNMTLHHVADTERLLRGLHAMLAPGGTICLSDLDTEPGIFHPPEVAASVYHFGFDRGALKDMLRRIGFDAPRDVTAHTVIRPVADGHKHAFPIFLITAVRAQ